MELEPLAIQVIAENSKGRALELGTGSRKGTEAALKRATHVVTVDHLTEFYDAARADYTGDPRVTPMLCELKDNTYVLPDDIGQFDTIIVDGPVGTEARDATLGRVIPLLLRNGRVIVDDAIRDRVPITKWADHFQMDLLMLNTPRGVAILAYAD